MRSENRLLDIAEELQSIAQNGLAYVKDVYDMERYTRLRELSAELMSMISGEPIEKVKDLFCTDKGYQTPKIDTRSAVFREGEILLVKENNGEWSLPGGWFDPWLSVGENAVKETKEESGMDVTPLRIIAVQDRDRHNKPEYAWKICKVFVLCRLEGGEFAPNSETVECGFFSLDELPELCGAKNTREQVEMCFEAAESEDFRTLFD